MEGKFRVTKIVVPGVPKKPKEPDVDRIELPIPRPYMESTFRLMIVGPSGKGKSNVFVSLLTEAYIGIFSHVYLFCPTYETDETLQVLTTPNPKTEETFLEEGDIFTYTNKEEIEEAVRGIEIEASKNKKETPKDEIPPKTLVVFDDLMSELYNSKDVQNLFTRGRKAEISIIIIAQKYKVFKPAIRNNLSHIITFEPGTKQELEDIAKDFSGSDDVKKMEMAMRRVFKKSDKAFVFIDNSARWGRVWDHFEKNILI